MGVDAYQTYQTSRTTFSAALSAGPVTIIVQDTALSLGQVSTKYPSRCRPKTNQIIPTITYRPSVKCRPFTGRCTLLCAAPKLIAALSAYAALCWKLPVDKYRPLDYVPPLGQITTFSQVPPFGWVPPPLSIALLTMCRPLTKDHPTVSSALSTMFRTK